MRSTSKETGQQSSTLKLPGKGLSEQTRYGNILPYIVGVKKMGERNSCQSLNPHSTKAIPFKAYRTFSSPHLQHKDCTHLLAPVPQLKLSAADLKQASIPWKQGKQRGEQSCMS